MDVIAPDCTADLPASPVVLIATGNRWALAARIAIAVGRNGWKIVAACPLHSPLCFVKGVREVLPLGTLGLRDSLIGAIRRVHPDFVVPCDDSTVFLLHEIHSRCPDLRSVIERSLGDPNGFPIVESRDQLQRTAAELAIRVPRSVAIDTPAQAVEQLVEFSQAAVVKLDGTYGGEGVSVVTSEQEASAAFRRARSATSALTAIKRAIVNRDPYAFWNWRRQDRARVTIQEFISGTPANIMVACWQGKILAQISVEALSCQGATGAANVVRRIHRPEFGSAASALAARLKLSGFFGLDFIIERDTGIAYLIEMNPRCTQLGHLEFPDQGSLAAALCECISGRPAVPATSAIREATIAFFPQAWRWKRAAAEWSSAYHDIPWGEEVLIENLLGEPWPDRQWPARIYHWFRTPQQAPAADYQPVSKTLAPSAPAQPLAGESLRP